MGLLENNSLDVALSVYSSKCYHLKCPKPEKEFGMDWFLNSCIYIYIYIYTVDLGAMAMKSYSAFSKAPALQEPHHQIV